MNNADIQYLDLAKKILETGNQTGDRTGTGTRSLFGEQLKFDLSEGFPLLTTKKVWWKGVVHELLWLLSGSTNVNYLKNHGVNIWNEWADENGDLGPVYSKQWRDWTSPYTPALEGNVGPGVCHTDGTIHVDQIQTVIDRIKSNPTCRRLMVSAWNPGELHSMALPPCHSLFQFKVYGDTLHCQLYQRSADFFLGVPFNIASYALLTHMIASLTDLKVGTFTHTFGDVHIYNNHTTQMEEQLDRIPFGLPGLNLNPDIESIDDFTFSSIQLNGYESHPAIKGAISV